MPLVCNFVGALAVTGKMFKEIEETVKTVYNNKALKKMQLYEFIKKVEEGKPVANHWLQLQKEGPVSDFVTKVAAEVAR